MSHMVSSSAIAIIGATTVVGGAICDLLAGASWPLANVHALDLADLAGESVYFGHHELTVGDYHDFDFTQVQAVVICHAAVAHDSDLARELQQLGLLVVLAVDDVANCWPQAVRALHKTVATTAVALPLPVVSVLAQALLPIQQHTRLRRVSAVSMEAVSDYGQAGIEELASQTTALFNQQPLINDIFPQRMAFNILPLSQAEQDQAQQQLAQLLLLTEDNVTVRRHRVPVFFGHTLNVEIETEMPVDLEALCEWWRAAGCVVLAEEALADANPMSVTGQDTLTIARINRAETQKSLLNFWLCADNVRVAVAKPVLELLATGQ